MPTPFKVISRKLNFVAAIVNPVGAFLTFLYFQIIDPAPVGQQAVRSLDMGSIVIFIVIMVGLFALSGLFVGKNFVRIESWYTRLREGASPTEVPAEIQRSVLNYSVVSALMTFLMWTLAGITYLILNLLSSEGSASYAIRFFGGVVGVGGVLTTPIHYFIIDQVWREVIGVFFPRGELSRIKSFRLPVLGRLLIVFLLIGLWPLGLMASLSFQRAGLLVTSAYPQAILDNLLILQTFLIATGLLASVGLAVFVTRSIVHPLREMQNAMSRVEQNDFNTQVAVTSNDELGYLGERFNQMTAGLRQGELLRNLLNLYVSPQVARQAIEQGTQLGGTLVECTVLFSDIRSFTTLSENLPPAELIGLLNRYMSAMVQVIIEQGGIVNKFGGDSLLAVFGTPLNPASDHAARAVSAAMNMRQSLARFNQEQAKTHAPMIRIGIGVATGQVVAGNVGGQGRIEYTVIGDTVNLASRLQDKTKELDHEILISAETYHAASAQLSLNSQLISGVTVKGKNLPLDVYAVT